MTVTTLSAEEAREFGVNRRVTLDYTDLAALGASATGTIDLFTALAGEIIDNCFVDLETAFDFSDASMNSLLMELRDSSTAFVFNVTAGQELAADGTEVLLKAPTYNEAVKYPIGYVADTTIQAAFTAAGGTPTLAETTSGKVHIYFNVIDTRKLRAVRTR